MLAALGTVAALVAARGLRIEHAQEKYAPPRDDPVVRSIEDFRHRFGARTLLVAGLDFGHVIGVDEVRTIQDVERQLRALPRVARVFGLAGVRRVRWGQSGPRAVPVVETDSVNEANVERLRRLVEDTPIYRRGLVSSDWHMAGLVVELERVEGPGREARESRLALQVDSVLQNASSGQFDVYLTGMPLLNRAIQDSARRDVRLFGWLTVVIVGAILLMLFRHWRPVVLAGLVAAVALTWTLGVLAVSGTPMSASLTMLVPLVLVLSVAFSVHYLTHFYGGATSDARRDRFRAMMGVVFTPSILTGLTTTAGFIALATSRLESVRETGLFLAAGVLLTMAASSVLLPALLSLPLFGGRAAGRIAPLPSRLAHGMAAVVCRRAWLMVGAAGVLVVLAFAGVVRLRFDANPLHFFPREHPLRRSTEVIDHRLGGSLPLEILVRRAPEDLDGLIPAVVRVEEQLRGIPDIGFVGSAVDFLQLAETSRPRVMPRLYDPETGRFPPGRWSRLAAEQSLQGYVVHDSTALVLRITSRMSISDSDALRRLVARVERVLDAELPEEESSVTGVVPLLLRTQEHLVRSQISSFALAFFMILVLVFPVVRFWRVGVLAVIANLAPLVITIGAMGWLGIPVDIASIMIASIALGIIVDDTIHFLYRYRIGRTAGLTVRGALEQTYAVVGIPLIVTSVVFVGGFLTLTLSTFQPTSIFGLLAAVTITAAFVADLLLLPALLVVILGRSRKEAAGSPDSPDSRG
jgi:predicted RND superfamily exporter protein